MKIDVYNRKNTWKFFLFICAVGIGLITLLYTETFLQKLRQEEEKRMVLWAEAVNTINNSPVDTEINLASMLIESNTTIPIIMTDENGQIIRYRNLDPNREELESYQKEELERMKAENEPIEIRIDALQVNYLYYRNSTLLRQLRLYPWVLLGVIGLLVTVAYLAFSASRRSEQNRVWTGMAKETAHQIGTPLSSLMGWIHLLKDQNVEEMIVEEMDKDVKRLELLTDRFSKIGSIPEKKPQALVPLIERALDYLRKRTSSKIHIGFTPEEESKSWQVLLNAPLFEWVLENLIKNSIDAMDGIGTIEVELSELAGYYKILVRDTGKGMTAAQGRRIFRAGFTTKKRGWGLGLTLAKRIVEEYHGGTLTLLSTELGKGTVMQVRIPKI